MDIRSFFGPAKTGPLGSSADGSARGGSSHNVTFGQNPIPTKKRRLKRLANDDDDTSDAADTPVKTSKPVQEWIKEEIASKGGDNLPHPASACDASNLQIDIECWTSDKKALVDPLVNVSKAKPTRQTVDLDTYLDTLGTSPHAHHKSPLAQPSTATQQTNTAEYVVTSTASTLDANESNAAKSPVAARGKARKGSACNTPTIKSLFSSDSSVPSGASPSPTRPGEVSASKFVFTGLLKSLDRDTAISKVRNCGGVVVSAVSGKVDYLVTGEKLEDGRVYTKGMKYKKAMELNRYKNANIKILKEDEFLEMIEKQAASRPVEAPVPPIPISTAAAKLINCEAALTVENSLVGQSARGESSGALLSERYRPTSLSEICGNTSLVERLVDWLNSWESVHLRGIKRDVKKRGFATENVNAACALLSGPPGIGKTTTAKLAAKHCGYECIEFNASDLRNKSAVERISLLATGGNVLAFGAGAACNNGVPKRSLVLLDEVDGMSGGDRGGLQAIVALIPQLRCPLICICNDRHNQKLTSLAGKSLDLRFNLPHKTTFLQHCKGIIAAEKLQVPPSFIDSLFEESNGDFRHALNAIEFVAKCGGLSSSSKDLQPTRNFFEACAKAFRPSNEPVTSQVHLLEQLYFCDYSIIPMFIQENYLKFCSKRALIKVAPMFALGDLVDEMLKKTQNYSMLVDVCILTTVYPVIKVKKDYMASGERIGFPQFLGKTSTRTKNRRLLGDVSKCLGSITQVKGNALIMDGYLELLHDKLMNLLDENVDAAFAEIASLGLNKELFVDGIATSLRLASLPNVYGRMAQQKRSLLSRKLNAQAVKVAALKKGKIPPSASAPRRGEDGELLDPTQDGAGPHDDEDDAGSSDDDFTDSLRLSGGNAKSSDGDGADPLLKPIKKPATKPSKPKTTSSAAPPRKRTPKPK